MAVQARVDIDTTDFVIGENLRALREDAAVILQIGARAIPLAQYTFMGQISATGKWIPLVDLTAVDGTAENLGIYMGADIPAADLVAGDVIDLPIIYNGLKFDEAKLVFDQGTLDIDSVIGAASVNARTVRQALRLQDLIAKTTDLSTNYENA